MSDQKAPLSIEEIQAAIPKDVGPILTVKEFCALARVPIGTFRMWLAKGWFDAAVERPGKSYLIWRDRAIQILFSKEKRIGKGRKKAKGG